MKLHKEHLEKSKNYIKEKATLDTNKTVESFNNDNTSTFDKINELKQKLNLIDDKDKDNVNLNYFRDNNL
jgi:hypothetical protein